MKRAGRASGRITRIVVVTVLVLLLAAVAVLWSAQKQYLLQESHQASLAKRSAQSAAREIVTLLEEQRRGVRQFVEDHRTDLAKLADHPEDSAAEADIAVKLKKIFPDHFSFTLATKDGDVVVDDFGETVGDLCRLNIRTFAKLGLAEPIIHPGPRVYHFDLMVPWQHDDQSGIFFISFQPDRLANLLASAQLPGHRLILVRDDQPRLIEITEAGGRDRLGGQHMLAPEVFEEFPRLGAEARVQGTGWRLLSLPDFSILQQLRHERLLRGGTSLALLLLAGGAILWSVWWDARRRTMEEARMRLSSAVFNSAQEGVAITDLEGRILEVNQAFTTITEYEREEILGETPRLLQSGRQDRDFYRAMWHELKASGFWQGEIWNRRKSGDIYLEWLSISSVRDELGNPVNYVAIYTDISRIRHAQSQLEHFAHHDALTDLPNRLLLAARLTHAIEIGRRKGTMGALLFLDLDGFKAVNDSHGHAAGDELLQQVAHRLGERLREADTLARPGGDEFVILLEDIEGGGEAARVAEDAIALLSKPFLLSGGVFVEIGVSIGIALFPSDGETEKILMERADAAMYRAKQAGRGTFRFCSVGDTRITCPSQ